VNGTRRGNYEGDEGGSDLKTDRFKTINQEREYLREIKPEK